jgi:hypothetical protein
MVPGIGGLCLCLLNWQAVAPCADEVRLPGGAQGDYRVTTGMLSIAQGRSESEEPQISRRITVRRK